MEEKVFDKLSKVNELIKRGSTEGEQQAAKLAFKKLVDKHGITEEQLKELFEADYVFTFSNLCEDILLAHIVAYVLDVYTDNISRYRYTNEQRKTYVRNLTKLQYIQILAMYEYFRRHMKIEYKKHIKEVVEKTYELRAIGHKHLKVHKERWKAQQIFIKQYVIVSKIDRFNPNPDKNIKTFRLDNSIVNSEQFDTIQGGSYHEQIMADSRSLDYTNE